MNNIKQRDVEFFTDTNEAVLQGVPIAGHFILWGALVFFLIALIWAKFAILDEVTVGDGKVIPSSDLQVVQNLEGGIVKSINVKVGDVVDKDQLLMVIDDTRFSSSYRESEVKIAALKAKEARLMAEANQLAVKFPEYLLQKYPKIVEDESALLATRKNEHEIRFNILNEQLYQKQQELLELERRQQQLQRSFELVDKEFKLTKPLVKDGAVSEVELLRLERQVNELQGELQGNAIAIPKMKSEIAGAKRKVEEFEVSFKTETLKEFNDTSAEVKRLLEATSALQDRVDRTSVRSPVRGTVNKINIKTIGGIIQPGESLVEIVPLEDSLLIEAQVRPADIGFIRPGLKATVKLTAYDFAIYGGLKGVVERIGADTITNEKGDSFYQILVRTETNYLGDNKKHLAIIPGMRATVDILTGEKSVLDYLLKPILKTKQNALRER